MQVSMSKNGHFGANWWVWAVNGTKLGLRLDRSPRRQTSGNFR